MSERFGDGMWMFVLWLLCCGFIVGFVVGASTTNTHASERGRQIERCESCGGHYIQGKCYQELSDSVGK